MEEEFCSKVAALEEKIDLLVTEVEVARHERDILSERLDDLQSNTIRAKKGQKFLDGVRQCCIELLAMNVATNQVEPVIRSVLLNIASIEVGELLKSSTLSGMLVEMKCLAYDLISEDMSTKDKVTLHSGRTSKFGEHYGCYQISTEHGSYSLGLCEMLTGSAEVTPHTFKQIVRVLCLERNVGMPSSPTSRIRCPTAISSRNTSALYLKTIELMCYHRWYKAGASYLKLNKTNYFA